MCEKCNNDRCIDTCNMSRSINVNNNSLGRDGESAYEIAVRIGEFSGTEEEFIESLKGEKGDDGTSYTGPNMPFAQKNQIPYSTTNNDNEYYADDIIKEVRTIFTDEQLVREKLIIVSFEDIFNTWKRFSHGGTISDQARNNLIPSLPLTTNAWTFITPNISCTDNTNSNTGFISPDTYIKYLHRVTLVSSGSDNDRIGVIIAYVEDEDDLIPNQAYGLSSGDFNWPINVTDQFIPNQHTISLIINRDGSFTPTYALYYDFMKSTQKLLATTTLSYNTTSGWLNNEIDIEVVRDGDNIQTKCSEFSDAPGGKGSLSHLLSIDLSTDADLEKFRGATAYGYCAQSQDHASYKNASFSDNLNSIFDIRNGSVWIYNGTIWVIDSSRNFFNEIGIRKLCFNKNQRTTVYIKPNKSYTIIKNDFIEPVDDSAGILTNANLNTLFPQVIIGQKAASATKEYIKNATGWYYISKTNCT